MIFALKALVTFSDICLFHKFGVCGRRAILQISVRNMCTSLKSTNGKGLVLGIFENEDRNGYTLTKAAEKFDVQCNKQLSNQLTLLGECFKKGSKQIFYGLDKDYCCVCVVNLGKQGQGYNEQERWNEYKETVRTTASVGSRALRDCGANSVEVDSCGEPEAAAEGCTLGLYSFDELKKESSRKSKVETNLSKFEDEISIKKKWQRGVITASSQNISRRFKDTPANLMTPFIFSERVKSLFKGKENVTVHIRDKSWAESKKMGSFLSVASGSSQPPYFVEVHYNGGPKDQKPIALVGKGITFDSGGISLKPAANMDKMRADMGGAAVVVGSLHALVELKVPCNIIALTPMTENMPGASATKPGDVVTAMNGKTIQIDNTDAEGRLVLADALCYAHEFNPRVVVDMATLTGAISIALGRATAGVFTNSTKMFDLLFEVSKETGDRVWRLPVFDLYKSQLTDSTVADINNVGSSPRMAGASVAAAFLREFVSVDHWLHLDISGVKENSNEVPYLGKGFTGRPLRTIVDFIEKLATTDD